MDAIFPDIMVIKEWTPDEIRDFVERARRKKIYQRELSEDYIGVSNTALQNWMRGQGMSTMARFALSFAELMVEIGTKPTKAEEVDGS